jgi:hypothetical protein
VKNIEGRGGATALASSHHRRDTQSVKCVFLPLEAQPSEDFPPSALAAKRNHTTYSWPHACEANCDFNHAARRLPMRSDKE